MKRLLIFILVLASAISGVAQSNTERYASRMTLDGTIFFLMPQRLKQLSGIQRFEYDMTCLTWSDTITINFTIRSRSMELPSGVCLQNENGPMPAISTEILYTDLIKGGYEIRMSCKFRWSEIKNTFTNTSAPVFSFNQGSSLCSATYKHGKWRRERDEISAILQLFEYSRK